MAPKSLSRAGLGLLLVVTALGLSGSAGAAPTVSARTTDPSCKRPAQGFTPSQATIPAIGRSVRVIRVARTSDNQAGAGPVTEEGKWLMAMDPHTLPGGHRGTVLLSGHTYPDGSALGNAMLGNLGAGDRVVLTGSKGKKACYRISQRKSYPANKVPSDTAFRNSGPEQMVIVACSGTRTGPGRWTHRTLWYAVPDFPASTSTPPKPPADDDPPTGLGGLLGGLLGGGSR